jgi:hypothetical protein
VITYTFVWQQPPNADNPFGFWMQYATYESDSVTGAWDQLIKQYGECDWSPQVGQSVFVIFGEWHQHKLYYRVSLPTAPRILAEVTDGKDVTNA